MSQRLYLQSSTSPHDACVVVWQSSWNSTDTDSPLNQPDPWTLCLSDPCSCRTGNSEQLLCSPCSSSLLSSTSTPCPWASASSIPSCSASLPSWEVRVTLIISTAIWAEVTGVRRSDLAAEKHLITHLPFQRASLPLLKLKHCLWIVCP